MLFYASLFVTCVIVSAVVLWIYRLVAAATKTAYRSFLPSSRGNIRHQRMINQNVSTNSARTPWGWSSTGNPRRALPVAAKIQRVPATPSTTPWGWPGNKSSAAAKAKPGVVERVDAESTLKATPGRVLGSSEGISSNKKSAGDTPMVGWPYREESFEFAGKQYKVLRKPNKRRKNIGGVSKPWGW